MPPPAETRQTDPLKIRATFPGSWLDERDKRLIAWALGGTLLFALALGAMMIGLTRADLPVADPDANTPVIAPDYQRQLTDFSLTDQAGHSVTRADLAGKIVVVDFIFTSCSVTCPYVNAQMEKIQRATEGKPVRLLSITLDPADDSAPVLARYAPEFNADPARWSFLTGDKGVIHDLVGTSFLTPDTTGEFAYMPGNFAHVQRIVLVDPSGKVVSYFDGLNQNAADAVLAQIQKLENSP
jgi:cytochrome oxidase Cu insertion factor (SCO1/SenC/PrrC family)